MYLIEKFKYLYNNPVKKIALTAILIFSFFSLGDVEVLFYQNTDFDLLHTSEGKMKIGPTLVRGGTPFKLIINKQGIIFSCGMGSVYGDNCILGTDEIKKYQGKIGKVWWAYNSNGTTKRLFQLEVEKKIIISYPEQAEKYIKLKESHFPQWIASLLLSLYWFIKLQFSNY